MKNEPDFSGINPLRVKTARHRLNVIEDYLSLRYRTAEDKLAAAKSVGLSTSAFQRLVNNWQKYKSVSRLVVNGKLPVRKKKLQPEVRKMIFEEIENAGHTASVSKIHRLVSQNCKAMGLNTPSLPAVYNILLEAQSQRPELIGGAPRVVIGRMWFKLPVRDKVTNEVTTKLGQVLAAVALPERVIVSHVIAIGEIEPSFQILLNDLHNTQTPEAPFRPLVMNLADLRANRAHIDEHGFELMIPLEIPTQRELKRAFGHQFGMLTPFYQRNLLKPRAQDLLCRQDHPLTEGEARNAIEATIADSNAKWRKLSDKLTFKLCH